jgi:hypothetical protein
MILYLILIIILMYVLEIKFICKRFFLILNNYSNYMLILG